MGRPSSSLEACFSRRSLMIRVGGRNFHLFAVRGPRLGRRGPMDKGDAHGQRFAGQAGRFLKPWYWNGPLQKSFALPFHSRFPPLR